MLRIPGIHQIMCRTMMNPICFIQGAEYLTWYTFNTHQAKHTFCKKCGVQSFYTPRSNPDGKGIAIHCLDSGTVLGLTRTSFDGQNWEDSIECNTSIVSRSKK